MGRKRSLMVRLIHVTWKCGCSLKQIAYKDQSFVNGSVFQAARTPEPWRTGVGASFLGRPFNQPIIKLLRVVGGVCYKC